MRFKLACLTLYATLYAPAVHAAVTNAPASGALEAPRGTVSGDVYVLAAARDDDGLYKVAVVFTGGGRSLVLCHDDDPTMPCSGTSGQWSRSGVDPSLYGVPGSATLTVGLWVEDETGWKSLVAQETVGYTAAAGSASTGQIREPGGTYAGDVLVRALADDADGVARVELGFGPGTSRLVVCDPCTGNDWVSTNVDPGAYGATAGTLTPTLYVRDGGGTEQAVASRSLEWQPVSGSAPSGQISSPNDFVAGDIFVTVNAADPDGLDRVAVELGSGDVELCGTVEPCLGSIDSWRRGGVDPGSYGLTAGLVDLDLAVTDDTGSNAVALRHTFDWEPASAGASSGTITSVTDRGDGTVDVFVTVRDPDSLYRVSLEFVPRGTPYAVCDDGGSPTCPGGTVNTALSAAGVDPRAYGAVAGSVTVGLWVVDWNGFREQVDEQTFTYLPPAADGVLSVTPAGGTGTSGEEGGPFGPLASYTVENTGGTTLSYAVTASYSPAVGSWLNVGNASGTLTPGATSSVGLSVSSAVADSLAAGTYTASLSFANQTNGLGDTTRNVTLTVEPAAELPPKVGGTITDTNGNPIEGVRIDGMPVVHWTDAAGNYGRVVGEGWSGTVTPSKAGFTFTPPSRTYSNVTESQLSEDYTGDGKTLGITGRVTAGAGGLEGVTLEGLPGPTVTAADGSYTAIVPFGFTGRVTPTKAGYVFTPPYLDYDDIRGWRYDQDYNAAVAMVTLSGRVTRGTSGLSGVWLAGLPGGVVTDANGDYSASVQLGWSGTVTPQRTGYGFTPASRTYTHVSGGEPGDYSASSLPAGSNRLWLVANDSEMNEATIFNRAGDMILVEPGTYVNADTGGIDPGVTLLSTGGADVTILQRSGDHRFSGDDITVDGFTFEATSATEPVRVFGDRVKIRNSRFKPPAGEYSLRATSASDLLVEGSVFDQIQGILVRSGTATGEMVVRNNEFKNLGYGINAGSNPDLRLRVENNVFKDSDNGLDVNDFLQVTVRNNVFANIGDDAFSRAVDVQDLSQQSPVVHNVFYQCSRAVHVCNASVLVYDSIFQENTQGIDGCSGGTVNVHHDLIWGGTWLWAGPTYIEDPSTIWRDVKDPRFINPAACDFHLGATSQAKGLASDGTDLGAYGGALGGAWTPVPGTPQTPPALLGVRIEGRTELSAGETVTLKAEGDYESGFYAVLTRKATWTSSNEAVLRSLGNGAFEAVAPGSATVNASWDGQSGTATVTVLGAALVLAVTDTPDPVLPGATLRYNVTWRNDGPGTVFAARWVASYDSRTSSPSPSIPADAGTNNTWTLGDLAAGASGAMTIDVDVAATLVEGDVLGFSMTLETGFLGSSGTAASTSVAGRGDLAVTKSCVPAQGFPGDEVTCTLSWSNGGSGTAPGAQVVESYPSGLTFLRGRPAPSSGTSLWLLGDVARGATGSLEVDLRIDDDAVGDLVNQVAVLFDEADLDPSDDTATFTLAVTPRADLALAMSADPDPVAIGETVTWRLTVTNGGPSVATELVVEHVLPAGTQLAATPSGDGWSCSARGDVTVTCTRTALGSGFSSTLDVPVTAPSTAGSLETSAQVDAVTVDPNASNDSAVLTVTVEDPVPATILLVDDDDGTPDVRGAYTNALDTLGPTYDVWDTGASDNEPDASTLGAYKVVIWLTGDHTGGFAGPGPSAEMSLGSYLDGGGCLLITSQDYLWDRGGATHDQPTAFMSAYLGVGSAASDVRQGTVTGAGAFFGGRGPYTLAFPYGNFSDRLTPDATAEVVWTGDQSDAAVAKSTGVYATSFWGFGLEAIPTATSRADVLADFLVFCAQLDTVFSDGFESGGVTAWSSSVGSVP